MSEPHGAGHGPETSAGHPPAKVEDEPVIEEEVEDEDEEDDDDDDDEPYIAPVARRRADAKKEAERIEAQRIHTNELAAKALKDYEALPEHKKVQHTNNNSDGFVLRTTKSTGAVLGYGGMMVV